MIIVYWAFLLAITAFSTSSYAGDTLARINETQTVRCGYVEYSPAQLNRLEIWDGSSSEFKPRSTPHRSKPPSK